MILIDTKGTPYKIIGVAYDKILVQEIGKYFTPQYIYLMRGGIFKNIMITFKGITITNDLMVNQSV